MIKRNALPPDSCTAARNLLWKNNASAVLARDAPESWLGPLPKHAFEGAYEDSPGDSLGAYGWQVRSIGNHPVLLDLLPHACLNMAEQLLGCESKNASFCNASLY